MDLGLKGKRAIVTGGSGGIGGAIALALAAEAAQICAVGRDPERLAAIEAAVCTTSDGFALAADLATEEGCRSAVEACVARYGGVDILINCAGAAQQQPVLTLPGSIVMDAIALKLVGYMRMAQLVIPHMQRQGWGRIVNIAGNAATQPTTSNLPSSFANAGVLNLSRALTDVTARDGILVNSICPAPIDDERTRRHLTEAAEREGRQPDVEADIRRMGAAMPAGRLCTPDEIAPVACFLASEACTYVFATAVYMDGGARRGTL